MLSTQSANTALAFAAIGLLAVIGIGAVYSLVGLQRLLLPWANTSTP